MSELPDREEFAGARGEPFEMVVDDRRVPLVLAELASLGDRSTIGKREPFSLLFHAPVDALYPQRIYTLEHERLGTMDLFLVPLGPEGDAMRYEAVFT